MALHRFTGQVAHQEYRYPRFKGDDATFGDFPSRLQHMLSETVQGMVIESIVFPAYEVRRISIVIQMPYT
jgi:hypothetical protein